MKKLALLLTVVMLIGLAGCCTLTAPDGTVTKNAANCFKAAQDKVCNAPESVLTIADVVINLLKPEAAALIPGSAPFIALVTAQNIKDTGCAAFTGLNTMITFIQSYNLKSTVAMKAVNVKVAVKAIPVKPLENWRDKSGK